MATQNMAGLINILCLVRGLLGSLIVMCLPPGVGVVLITLASLFVWRLTALVPTLARRRAI